MLERNIQAFDSDVASHGGYKYTTNAPLSAWTANRRMTDVTLQMVSLKDRRVIDIGCGDGTYTYELCKRGQPAEIVGADAAANAVQSATEKFAGTPGLIFRAVDVYSLEPPNPKYDVAIVRGLLHHLDRPELAVQRITTLATRVLLIEPNGYSPALKVIEKVSAYHRAHDEKSFAAARIRSWILASGGVIEAERYLGLVPFFCPDWAVGLLKALEPMFEAVPGLRQMCLAQFAVSYRTEP